MFVQADAALARFEKKWSEEARAAAAEARRRGGASGDSDQSAGKKPKRRWPGIIGRSIVNPAWGGYHAGRTSPAEETGKRPGKFRRVAGTVGRGIINPVWGGYYAGRTHRSRYKRADAILEKFYNRCLKECAE